MSDGSLKTFAVLPPKLGQESSYSRTFDESSPPTKDVPWHTSVKRWPTTASADGTGRLYERPTLVPRIVVTGGSALPTPTTSDANGPGAHGDGGPDLRTKISDLFPTPAVTDMKGGSPNHRSTLADWVKQGRLLPTPTASQPGGTPEQMLARKANMNPPRQTVTDLRMVLQLLPTPTRNDYKNAGYQKGKGDATFPTLPGAVGSAPTKPRSSGGST